MVEVTVYGLRGRASIGALRNLKEQQPDWPRWCFPTWQQVRTYGVFFKKTKQKADVPVFVNS